MSNNWKRFSLLLSLIVLMAVFDNKACANSIKVDVSKPLANQLVRDNTTYEISNDCYVSRIRNRQDVVCDQPVDVVRGNFAFCCNEKITINNKTYYITPEQIRIYWNESLIFPGGCVVIDSQKKQILSKGNTYHNPNGNTVYIGSEKKREGTYQHCKVYYASNESVELGVDEGLVTTDDCVILDKEIRRIKTYHPCYIADKQEKIYIAKREKGRITYEVLKVLTLPDNITLKITRGQIKNGILKCNGLQITDSKKQLFSNVVLTGMVSNASIKAEWFGCSVRKDGKENYDIISKYVFPSALFTHSNIFHSQKGTYNFAGGYPIKNYHWGYDHNYIMNCEGIEVYGTGPKTIIRGVPTSGDNPADVFCFADVKNIDVHDLSVTAIEGNGKKTHGTNAFSLCQSVENITINNTTSYDLPVVHMPSYPDGAKGYTIQVEAGSYQSNILIKDNVAKNVAYGFDYTRTSKSDKDYRKDIRFIGNRIQNAIAGCVIHEEVSPDRNETERILVEGNEFKNCQVGMYCMLVKALTVKNNKFIKNKRVPLTKYYSDYYGLFIAGAFNTTIENNQFTLNDCKSFIYITQYSFYPVWHGEISSLDIDGVTIKGKSRGDAVDVASDAKTEEQKNYFKNVSIRNIKK